jgi:hypothetical protein
MAALPGRCSRENSASAGNAQITLDKYPRIVFGVSVSLERVLDCHRQLKIPHFSALENSPG